MERLNQTGEAEIITVNGEARAVMVSPAVYSEMARELELSRDVAAIRQSMKEIERGKGLPVRKVFAELRSELLALKAAREAAFPLHNPAADGAVVGCVVGPAPCNL